MPEAPSVTRSAKLQQSDAGPSGFGRLVGRLAPTIAGVMIGASLLFSAPAMGANLQSADPTPGVTTTAVDSTAAATSPVRAAVDRLLATDDNGDGRVDGKGWGDELGDADPLAKAVYAYIDYLNPRGRASGWGPTTSGDYMVGGLGLGYNVKPAHMTGNAILLAGDLDAGARDLEARLGQIVPDDQRGADLTQLLESGRAQGLLPKGDAEAFAKLHTVAAGLIDRASEVNAAEEKATGNSTAVVSREAFVAGLPEGSLERLVAETALAPGKAGAFFAERAWAGKVIEMTQTEGGKLGEVAQHYLLELAKEAKLSGLATEVAALTP